jgi:hypothetical protein
VKWAPVQFGCGSCSMMISLLFFSSYILSWILWIQGFFHIPISFKGQRYSRGIQFKWGILLAVYSRQQTDSDFTSNSEAGFGHVPRRCWSPCGVQNRNQSSLRQLQKMWFKIRINNLAGTESHASRFFVLLFISDVLKCLPRHVPIPTPCRKSIPPIEVQV